MSAKLLSTTSTRTLEPIGMTTKLSATVERSKVDVAAAPPIDTADNAGTLASIQVRTHADIKITDSQIPQQ